MPLTKEQLLIPRYKVIAGLPFKPSSDMYAIGDIITDDGKECARDQNGDAVFVCDWDEFPHIFQPLPWWSDRKMNDLPDYVVINSPTSDKGKCLIVSEWFLYETPVSKEESIGFLDDLNNIIGVHAVLPSDKEEYTAYINQK